MQHQNYSWKFERTEAMLLMLRIGCCCWFCCCIVCWGCWSCWFCCCVAENVKFFTRDTEPMPALSTRACPIMFVWLCKKLLELETLMLLLLLLLFEVAFPTELIKTSFWTPDNLGGAVTNLVWLLLLSMTMREGVDPTIWCWMLFPFGVLLLDHEPWFAVIMFPFNMICWERDTWVPDLPGTIMVITFCRFWPTGWTFTCWFTPQTVAKLFMSLVLLVIKVLAFNKVLLLFMTRGSWSILLPGWLLLDDMWIWNRCNWPAREPDEGGSIVTSWGCEEFNNCLCCCAVRICCCCRGCLIRCCCCWAVMRLDDADAKPSEGTWFVFWDAWKTFINGSSCSWELIVVTISPPMWFDEIESIPTSCPLPASPFSSVDGTS